MSQRTASPRAVRTPRSAASESSASPRSRPLRPGSSPRNTDLRPSATEDATSGLAVKGIGETQTDSSYPPGYLGRFDAASQLSSYHCKQYKQLLDFREHTKGIMTELGVSVYDLMSLKDIFLRMTDHLPHAPVTDLLLVSSKIFRRSGELARCLGAMYNSIFADDFTDDDFKFTEARIMKRTIRKLEEELATVKSERDELKGKHEALATAVKSHRSVVDGLQDENDALGARNTALEDNMAVLFQQIATDFAGFTDNQLADVQEELSVQEALSSARAQFATSIEAVQNRLRFFQSSLNEIQQDSANYDPSGMLKGKIKSLDVHANHLANRFDAVREGLQNTADELVGVMREKRKAVNLSLQHLKAYEVQNQRVRQTRSLMHELRQQLIEVERVFDSTFASGSLVKVDRGGEIHVSAAASATGELTDLDGEGGPRSRGRYTAGNTKTISDLIRSVVDLGQNVTSSLVMDDEHKAVLRAVAMAVPASRPKDGNENDDLVGGADGTRRASNKAPADGDGVSMLASRRSTTTAQIVRHASMNHGVGSGGDDGGGDGAAQPGGDMETYLKLREDFSVKASFLREVYEERIADLESRVMQLQKKLMAAKRESEEDKAALQRAIEGAAAKAATTGEPASSEFLDDKSAAIRTKEAWLRHKAQNLGVQASAGHEALASLGEFELRSDAPRGYISPLAAFSRIQQSTNPNSGARGHATQERNVYHTTAMGQSSQRTTAKLRTDSAREQHERNREIIRKLKDLEAQSKALAEEAPPAAAGEDP